MKTTIELSDDLALAAKQYATRHGLTLRAVIEDGIRSTLRTEQESRTRFRLRDASVGGSGLQAEFRGGEWSKIREAAYGERGVTHPRIYEPPSSMTQATDQAGALSRAGESAVS